MKRQIIKLIALLIFASVAMSGCSIEYRDHHRRHWDDNRRDRYDNNGRDHNDRYNRDRDHNDRDNNY